MHEQETHLTVRGCTIENVKGMSPVDMLATPPDREHVGGADVWRFTRRSWFRPEMVVVLELVPEKSQPGQRLNPSRLPEGIKIIEVSL